MKKKLLLIFLYIFLFAGATAGAFFLAKFLDEADPTRKFSDAEFLTSFDSWVKSDADSVIWTFDRDATCTVTTTRVEVFDCTWYLEDDTLGIQTSWLTTLEDEFTFALNREEKSFTITSLSDQKESTFVAKNNE